MSTVEFDENKFCNAYDWALNHGDDGFIKLISASCLSVVASKRSLIIPPVSVLKKISSIKKPEERIKEIQKYILNSRISPEKIKEYYQNSKTNNKPFTLRTLFGGKEDPETNKISYYDVKYDDDVIKFNDIVLEVVKSFDKSTLYRAKGALEPITTEAREEIKEEPKKEEPKKEEPKKEEIKAGKKKPVKRRSGIEEEDDDENEDESEDKSFSVTVTTHNIPIEFKEEGSGNPMKSGGAPKKVNDLFFV